ncbi:hypothetical protein GUJ93_ZPchr0004g38430 [Zizania palustris]|uniref:Uncharacterized protein n=1 Tax=Zizania palustris TaxID=103762 RepID=A0A8J5SYQ0_ZIZPA|nr:hypothetical protein GUJ93_ZPchr0004g38430 [Zizania palustris]
MRHRGPPFRHATTLAGQIRRPRSQIRCPHRRIQRPRRRRAPLPSRRRRVPLLLRVGRRSPLLPGSWRTLLPLFRQAGYCHRSPLLLPHRIAADGSHTHGQIWPRFGRRGLAGRTYGLVCRHHQCSDPVRRRCPLYYTVAALPTTLLLLATAALYPVVAVPSFPTVPPAWSPPVQHSPPSVWGPWFSGFD